MSSDLVLRGIATGGPLALVLGVAWRWRPSRRVVAGAVLATIWAGVSLLVVNVVAIELGWWSFQAAGRIAGVPVDLLFGWALLWGTLPPLVAARFPTVGVPAAVCGAAGALVAVDAVVMGRFEPVVTLHRYWLLGEVVNVVVVLVPAVVLGVATARDTHLFARAAIQVNGFATLLGFVVPSAVFSVGAGDWTTLLHRPLAAWAVFGVILVCAGTVGVQAVIECALIGRGTPVPFDPPKHLVSSGPFAYVSNPMQLGGAAVVFGWGAMIGDLLVLVVLITMFCAVITISNRTETPDLTQRFGAEFAAYRALVRPWRVSWRPRHPAGGADRSAVLTVAPGPVASVTVALLRRVRVHDLTLVLEPGRDRPGVRYVSPAVTAVGPAALSRALDHTNLLLALAGWMARCTPVGIWQWTPRPALTRSLPCTEEIP
ncbi:methyltransferase family protein [Nocardia sp. NPDC127579]|uniref:methyltransferase family protein n=1 Tax=Nocardia sp. NPDC127579 TaxID=3345402 RepID=UPI003627DD95